MTGLDFSPLIGDLGAVSPRRSCGTVAGIDAGTITVDGLARRCRVGDRVEVCISDGARLRGEVVALRDGASIVLAYDAPDGAALGDTVELAPDAPLRPSVHWLGRLLDAFGQPLDGRPLLNGTEPATLRRAPPPAAGRKGIGARLETGIAVFNTMLPIARGQRIGLFAGSGIGKSSLLAALARGVEADMVVCALIGERGRELGEFVNQTLGEQGMQRSIIVAATSDQSPLIKRRAAWTAMSVAETFREQGKHVLLLIDSVTRFAEAHREVALAAGEPPSLRAYPPSTAHMIAALAERAGPGSAGSGDITGIFSVLVAGSDMEDPVADILRGVLDGHVVLDRDIAERGRFPAIDVRRSVSRCLPAVATEAENALIALARKTLGAYHKAEPLVQTGLYEPGADAALDDAVARWPALDGFFTRTAEASVADSFASLATVLGTEQASAEVSKASGAPEASGSEAVTSPGTGVPNTAEDGSTDEIPAGQ